MSGQPNGFADKVSFIWSVADLLRGDFKAHEYGQVILPFTVLRRLECALAPTKGDVIDRAASLAGKVDNVDRILHRTAGHAFYNVSPLDLTRLLNDSGKVAPNLRTYLAGFSASAREVLEAYGFEDKIARLDKAGLLYQVVAKFAELDLAEASVTNDAMGMIFEELLRRFSEMSNETAGEHFTPREVIKLMVNILFAEDDDALTGAKPVRTLYDPACGTGGMLSVAQDHLRELNPDAVLQVYGQELNAETWAVCRSDLMLKGQDPERIILGNSLTAEDGHPGLKVDYALANPPFGVDWKKYADAVETERDAGGRYAPGLPRVSDGSLLFLMHMLSKMKPVTGETSVSAESGGTRLAIVFSGSPLFAGAAAGGESEIRRWILENDWLEGIVALPDQLFYNTGISTYFWILTNRKPSQRKGKVVLVDARDSWTKMGKSLGDKRKYLADAQITDITQLYADALDVVGTDRRVKIFDREVFGYQRITVERPLRRRWQLTTEAVDALVYDKAWTGWLTPPKGHADGVGWVHKVEQAQAALLDALHEIAGQAEATEAAYRKLLTQTYTNADVQVSEKVSKAILAAAAVPDPDAPVLMDRKGRPFPDPDLRDNESIGLPVGWLDLTDAQREQALLHQADQYLRDEIHQYVPEAWIDHTKTKIGYEVPFTRHFYEYVRPRPIAEIDADLADAERRIQELLGGLAR
jgi:type I restriction enzyme M protein